MSDCDHEWIELTELGERGRRWVCRECGDVVWMDSEAGR